MPRYETATLLTDLGHADEMVGIVHAIFREHAPATVVIDLCHTVAPGDARSAAMMLARSVNHVNPGLVMVSVGRRLERPAVAVSVGQGAAALVGPDNGSLAAAVAAVGGADAAVQLVAAPAETLVAVASSAASSAGGSAGGSPGAPSTAVHPARDVLAPAAAALCAGAPLASLGREVDAALLMPALVPIVRTEHDGTLTGEVLSTDLCGVAQLNVDRVALAQMLDGDEKLIVEWAQERRVAQLAPPGAPPVVAGNVASLCDDVHGLLEVHLPNEHSAADAGLARGVEVRLKPVT